VLEPGGVKVMDDGGLENTPEDVVQGRFESQGVGIHLTIVYFGMASSRTVPAFIETRRRDRSHAKDARNVLHVCKFLLLVEASGGRRRLSEQEVDQE
jgi:hypothetical protein